MTKSNPDYLVFPKDKLSASLTGYRSTEKKKLILSLSITLAIMFLELIGGLLINSIALVSDAWHMFTHGFAIMIGLIAIITAQKPSCHHKTYGLYRSEVLAAFINGLFLLFVVGFIIFESVERILSIKSINGVTMLILAMVGLVANVISILILHGSEQSDLNIKGVFYHMIGDSAASIGIVFVAIIIIYNPTWLILDPLISIGISIVILLWAIGILKDSTRVLLEMAPKGYDVDMIRNALKKNFSKIQELYNLHLWTITPGMHVFSAHIKISDNISSINEQEKLIENINKFLHEKFKIVESTIQITNRDEIQACFFDK